MTKEGGEKRREQIGKFSVEVDESIGLVVIVADPSVTVQEINDFRTDYLKQSGYKRVLWDGREGDMSGITSEQAKLFSDFQPTEGSRVAFLVPTAVDFGVTRMIGARMEIAGTTSSFAQFYEYDDAIAWLTAE
jgi:hypothetical protein